MSTHLPDTRCIPQLFPNWLVCCLAALLPSYPYAWEVWRYVCPAQTVWLKHFNLGFFLGGAPLLLGLIAGPVLFTYCPTAFRTSRRVRWWREKNQTWEQTFLTSVISHLFSHFPEPASIQPPLANISPMCAHSQSCSCKTLFWVLLTFLPFD